MKPILEIRNISKRYTINSSRKQYLSLRDSFVGGVRGIFKKTEKEQFWALEDINLDIYPGDTIGVIGRNGAGKSTLLKIISKITPPTKGYIKARGRVASLLEVGTGFHPELTGRENVFLNGSILGLKRKEILSRFDEIIDFSGVEQFLDTPLKHYSSGMQLRLAFSVAAYLEPDILVVDEVLAVGDLEFQKKCIGKMEEVSINQGRTVLLVSHNMGAIKKLCKKCILIEKGVIKNIDTPKLVIDQYTNRNLEMKTNVWLNRNLDKNKVLLKKIEILSSEGLPKVQFFNSQEVFIRLSITSLENIENFTIALDLIKNDEIVLRSRQIDFLKKDNIGSNKSYEFTCRIPKWFLNTGTFTIKPYLSIHCVESLFDNPDALVSFNVELDPERSKYHNVLNKSNHPGFIFPTLEWKYNEV